MPEYLSCFGAGVDPSRLLAEGYLPHSVEQAASVLTAANMIDVKTRIEYKARQAIVLQPGFEARSGSVFTAHTGMIDEGEFCTLHVCNYPYPFEQVTTISYVLARPGRTSLHIQDAQGRRITQLINGQYREAGQYQIAVPA